MPVEILITRDDWSSFVKIIMICIETHLISILAASLSECSDLELQVFVGVLRTCNE